MRYTFVFTGIVSRPNHFSLNFLLNNTNVLSINRLSRQPLPFFLYQTKLSPTFIIFIAAFSSLFRVCPHSQVHTLSDNLRSLFTVPQNRHILLDGNHLSITISCFPLSASLYDSIVRNIPKPLSFVDFPKLRD